MNHFSQRSRPTFPESRNCRQLNSKLSASKKFRAPLPRSQLTFAMTLLGRAQTVGARNALDSGELDGPATSPGRGESSSGRPATKPSATRLIRSSSTSPSRPLGTPPRTGIRCSEEWTTGARRWTEPAASTSTATMAWPWETSTTTASMIFTSASPPDSPTVSIAIAATEPSRT